MSLILWVLLGGPYAQTPPASHSSLLIERIAGTPEAQTPQNKALLERALDKHNQSASDGALNEGTENKNQTSDADKSKKEIKEDRNVLNDPNRDESKSIYEQMLRNELIVPDSLLGSLEVFGRAIFHKKVSSSAMISNQFPVPASYPIGPGDEVVVTLWGRINEEQRVKVNRNGMVNISHLGPVSVAGQTFATVQKNIADKLAGMEGVNVSVSMGELRSIQVYVAGEVTAPGLYMLSPLATVANALFAAGGVTKMGSLRSIAHMRGIQTVEKIDFYDFLLSGKNDGSARLEPNDVVFVPIVKQMAAVAGNVRRSAIFEIKSPATLKSLLELAGGITPGGWKNRLQVERIVQHEYKTVLDLDCSSDKELPQFSIEDGDVVKVFPVVVMDQGVVYLEGNVVRPGKYELKEGMRIADLIKDFAGLLPETYFQYALVKRYEPPSFLARIIPFNLRIALDNHASSENVALQSSDHVQIFPNTYFEPDRGVTIDGAVTSPGKFKLLSNMKIKDLILQAGGLTEDASPKRGEVYRRQLSGEKITTEKIDFCVQCALDGEEASNLQLEKSDRIFVRTKEGWEAEKRVTLKGEFMYPGTYILKEGETMGPLLARAGGFTEKAYKVAAVFTRASVRQLERKRTDDYSSQLESEMMKVSAELAAKNNPEEAQAVLEQQKGLLEKLKRTQPIGRVVIDLTEPESYQELVLEDGDSLIVPANLNTVSVLGEVFNPATFTLAKKHNDVHTYLQLSGGVKENADQKNIYIIKANGSIVTRQMTGIQGYNLQAGDVVVVPQKLRYVDGYRVFMDTIDAISKVVTAAAVVFTLIALLK